MNRLPRSRLLGATLLAASLLAAGCSAYRHPDPGEVNPAAQASKKADPPVVASIDTAFPRRPAFGVTLPELTQTNVDKLAATAGCKPTIVQRFGSVASGISLKTLQAISGMPMLSVEPWHSGQGPNQQDFTLKATIEGRWDPQYQQIAQSVVEYHNVVLVRFAHEMNGDWYPWSMANGNTAADFVAAWRHVVDLFRSAGATNVLWVWSPNILRGANSTQISQFWPGPNYVDIVGLTGYGVHETNPTQTYGPTLKLIQALTDKPLLLTEVGVQADSAKRQWISAFGQWLAEHPQVLGFVWFQSDRGDNWRFDDTQANLTSFKSSLKTAKVSC
jgi:hypothetical protein